MLPKRYILGGNKLNEQQKKAKLELLEEVLDNSSSAIFVKSLDGEYVLVNKEFNRLFGLQINEVYSKTDYDLFPKHVADTLRENDKQIAITEEAIEIEEEIECVDGFRVYISAKFPIYDEEGKLFGVGGIANDISEIRVLQKNLQKRAKELETFNKLIIGREERMIELKQEVNRLNVELGREEPYHLHESVKHPKISNDS